MSTASAVKPDVIATYEQGVQPTYGRTPVVFVRGEGARLWDESGKEYIDFVSGGRAGTGLGHCHPDVVRALQQQVETLMFVSNDFHHPWGARLGQLLAERSGGRKAFFCNSGAEATETALKLARKWSTTQYGPDRYEILTCLRSFHGRTLGALSATGQPKLHQGFEPVLAGFRYIPFNDAGALAAAITPQTCAVLLEPVQGESGTYPADPGYLPAVQDLCRRNNLLFMVDEVQTGFGRTGRFWAYEHYGVEPDVVTIAKALGGGLPVGACLAKPEFCVLVTGDHGCTFGGNPFCTAAAVAALEALDRHGYVENAARQGESMKARFHEWQRKKPEIKEVRGLGLMLAIEFSGGQAKGVVQRCLEEGLVVHAVGDSILRILPAVSITDSEAQQGMAVLEDAVMAA